MSIKHFFFKFIFTFEGQFMLFKGLSYSILFSDHIESVRELSFTESMKKP